LYFINLFNLYTGDVESTNILVYMFMRNHCNIVTLA
jgi:hypothetical protein